MIHFACNSHLCGFEGPSTDHSPALITGWSLPGCRWSLRKYLQKAAERMCLIRGDCGCELAKPIQLQVFSGWISGVWPATPQPCHITASHILLHQDLFRTYNMMGYDGVCDIHSYHFVAFWYSMISSHVMVPEPFEIIYAGTLSFNANSFSRWTEQFASLDSIRFSWHRSISHFM